jgi:hypothetical protein
MIIIIRKLLPLLLLSFLYRPVFAETVVIDDFKSDNYSEGKSTLPSGWINGNEKKGKYDYFVFKEGNTLFLRSEYIPGTSGKIIYIKKRLKIGKTPFLSWKWRARKFPSLAVKNGREEVDNVATVYAMFRKNLRSYVIKYQWSQINCKNTDDGKDNFFLSRRSSRMAFRPLRCTNSNKPPCCSDKPDVWLTEKVNIKVDYMRLFDKDEESVPENIEGVGVLSDGDDTDTPGVSADFADFMLLSE